MRILIASSEAVPYVKTGGLGDIAGTLAKLLSTRDHSVCLVIPLYKSIKEQQQDIKIAIPTLNVSMGDSTVQCRIWMKKESSGLIVYFIEHDIFFDRSSLYGDKSVAYEDNGARFAFFSKAILELTISIKFQPEIIHVNDWQTALIPYYLKTWHWKNNDFRKTATVLTIHNIGYQGQINRSFSKFIGINWMQMRPAEFESFQGINLLKGGIFYADQITTVSPTYAKEILSEPGGSGLSPFLKRRKDDVAGILNGMDIEEWNTHSNPFLPAQYDLNHLEGKAICKSELQKRFRLPQKSEIPLFAFVGRFAHQKGLNLLIECMAEILSWELQIVILGDGDIEYSGFFGNLPIDYPEKVGSYIGFEPQLAHLIEAGSDFFIMPSLYEPCGLNQMYSMIYGSVPIVRKTGGLNDTVENFDLDNHRGTGFVFEDMKPEALKNTIGWALDTWYNKKKAYKDMQKRAMKQDFSWKNPVKKYERIYRRANMRKADWY